MNLDNKLGLSTAEYAELIGVHRNSLANQSPKAKKAELKLKQTLLRCQARLGPAVDDLEMVRWFTSHMEPAFDYKTPLQIYKEGKGEELCQVLEKRT